MDGTTLGGATATGDISLVADTLNLASTIPQSTGNLTIAPYTPGTNFTPNFGTIPTSFTSFTAGNATTGTVNLISSATLGIPTTILGATIALANGVALNTGTNDLTLNASQNILLNPGSSLTSTSGDITLIANPGGTIATNAHAIYLEGGIITTTTGGIILDGTTSASGGSFRHGLYIRGGARVESTGVGAGVGSVQLTGLTLGSEDTQGIRMELGGTVQTVDANLTVNAISQAPSGNFTPGIFMQSDSAVRTTGTGALTLNATGTLGSYGLVLGTVVEATGTGDLLINALGGPTATADLFSNDWIINKTGGTATLNGRLSIGNLVANAGDYTVNLTSGGTIASGTFNHTGTLSLNNASTNTLTFTNGLTHTTGLTEVQGTIATVNSPLTLSTLSLLADTTLTTGAGDITFNGTIAGNDFDFTATSNSITANNAITMGTGNLDFTATRNIAFNPGSSVTSSSGSITFNANQQAVATTGNFNGIDLRGTLTTDSGAIVLKGRSGNTGASSGIFLPGSLVKSTSGTITLLGEGAASSSGAD
ncbi:hypothetical protein PROH_12005 [Prochlorothrix hollandica PCC 9006 = CALU 1027]|uniref:Filamentous haemagglutinin FhaB/tRNA nuclease CdiA-like TPS domain-containing protein n=3 Tax=Prochlorothrix hollandica TaxID=1223 RepID=A0A0M2PZ86_PROHO|nr:hypothetical protein PROH_12005 [Prochlorothrix hollandica PCC 9006 = CALU 1027]